MRNIEKFKKIYLHIGYEKTGTTTIQNYLSANRRLIRQDGFYIPGTIGDKNHKLLCASVLNPGSKDVSISSANIEQTDEGVLEFKRKTIENFNRELEKSSEEYLIITSEDFSRISDLVEIDRLRKILLTFSQKIEVIIFLRRQDLLAASRYYSLVLGGSSLEKVFTKEDIRDSYYNFNSKVDMWAKSFGESNIKIVKVPEFPKSANFNSVEVFCSIIGLDMGEKKQIQDKNTSLDAINQLILRRFNHLNKFQNKARRDKLLQYLKEFDTKRNKYFVSAPEAQSFYANFKESNSGLCQRFPNFDMSFSQDFSMYPETNLR